MWAVKTWAVGLITEVGEGNVGLYVHWTRRACLCRTKTELCLWETVAAAFWGSLANAFGDATFELQKRARDLALTIGVRDGGSSQSVAGGHEVGCKAKGMCD